MMKHPVSTTALLIFLFICAQIVGISLLSLNIKEISTDASGVTSVQHDTTVIGDRPQTTGGGSLLYIVIGVAIGTGLMLLIIKFKFFRFWKAWFLLAVWLSTSIAFGVVVHATIALILCFGLAIWKVFYPNPIVHNLTEIFMYAGIAILIAPLFTIWWAIALLGIISVYDMIAVWQSKHMVVMAEAQSENKLFAGLYIPKSGSSTQLSEPTPPNTARHATHETRENAHATHTHTRTSSRANATTHAKSSRVVVMDEPPSPPPVAEGTANTTKSGAILGGGDIAFPLIFSGVVMDWIIMNGASRTTALFETLFVTVGATTALTLLFIFAKRDRYYPAMPFISAGCFAGLAVIWLIARVL